MPGDTSYPLEYKFIPWIIAIITFFLCSFILLLRNRKTQKSFTLYRQFNYMVSAVLMSVGLIRILFLFSDIERVANGKSPLHFQILYTSYFIAYMAFSYASFYFDKFFIKSKHFIFAKIILLYTIIAGIVLIITPFLYEFLDLFRYILYSGLMLSLSIMLLMIFKVLRGVDIKKLHKPIYSITGVVLMAFGSLTDMDFIYDLLYKGNPFLAIFPAFLTILGSILFIFTVKSNFKVLIEFYTTQRICIVHRGKISGKIFFCPSCLVKYCSNCFDSVIKLENRCWVCNHQFEEGKEDSISESNLELINEVIDESEKKLK